MSSTQRQSRRCSSGCRFPTSRPCGMPISRQCHLDVAGAGRHVENEVPSPGSQATSWRNCSSALLSMSPRHIRAVSPVSTSNPVDTEAGSHCASMGTGLMRSGVGFEPARRS